ncbi:MAG: hypothetical protein OXR66_05905 [Candidatus Woesearchaeota archaeon]|nr:hypothetical protein [Candidatus Woesearchaeota archaeon]
MGYPVLTQDMFPVRVKEAGDRRLVFTDTFPPCHPTLARDGFDPGLVYSVLGEALAHTEADLVGVRGARGAETALDKLARDDDGLLTYGCLEEKHRGCLVRDVPFLDKLFIEKVSMNRLGSAGGDNSVRIVRPFTATEPVQFAYEPPQEVLREYELEVRDTDTYEYRGEHGWHTHNLSPEWYITFKNILIAVNNRIVKKKS